jgi:asparagine synthase (glutamine-hydrolysing)
MSGIVGIIDLDGAPVDRKLLERLTALMSIRGPDAQRVWSDGPVGFGHTLLRTTSESSREIQPFSENNRVWITADARIDGRSELIEKLSQKSLLQLPRNTLTDAELIARAYKAWGDKCVHHLDGDFAFAIWDEEKRQLFCARDHFGVKPFYYSLKGNTFIFSNTLDCLRMHPAISDDLNKIAIADFLLFSRNQDLNTTTFSDIQRLPPAHALVVNQSLRISQYWKPPVEEELRYKHKQDYVDHFYELFAEAVRDRARWPKVAVSLSGGLDSPSVAGVCVKESRSRNTALELQAFTMVYERLLPDNEKQFAAMVAAHLGIPITYLALDDYKLYQGWDRDRLDPEPFYYPLSAIIFDHSKAALAFSRVMLTGDGGDLALLRSWKYTGDLIRRGRMDILARTFLNYSLQYRRLPILGFRTTLRRWAGSTTTNGTTNIPSWINRTFAERVRLKQRVKELELQTENNHPTRPEAYAGLLDPVWPDIFEQQDPGFVRLPIERRNPFFDRRLIEFLLRVPPIPWFVEKEILRVAMKDLLPEAICRRPKTPLWNSPVAAIWEREWDQHFQPTQSLSEYIDTERFLADKPGDNLDGRWQNALPVSLNYWLHNLNRTRHNAPPFKGQR